MKVNVRKWLNSIVFQLCMEFPNRSPRSISQSVLCSLSLQRLEVLQNGHFQLLVGAGEASYCSKATAAAKSGPALTIIRKGFWLSLQAWVVEGTGSFHVETQSGGRFSRLFCVYCTLRDEWTNADGLETPWTLVAPSFPFSENWAKYQVLNLDLPPVWSRR